MREKLLEKKFVKKQKAKQNTKNLKQTNIIFA